MPLPPLLLKERPAAPTAVLPDDRETCTNDDDLPAALEGRAPNPPALDQPFEDDPSTPPDFKPYTRQYINTSYDFKWPEDARYEGKKCELQFRTAAFGRIFNMYDKSSRVVPGGWADLAKDPRAHRVSSHSVMARLYFGDNPILCVHEWEAAVRSRAVGVTREAPADAIRWAQDYSLRDGYLLKIAVQDGYSWIENAKNAFLKNNYWSLNIPLYRHPGKNRVVHFEADHNLWRAGYCNTEPAPDYSKEVDGAKLKDQVARFLVASARILNEADAGIQEAWLHDYAIVDDIAMTTIVKAVREAVGTVILNEYLATNMADHEPMFDVKTANVENNFREGLKVGLRALATQRCWRVKYYRDKLGALFYTTDQAAADATPNEAIMVHGGRDGTRYGVFPTRPMPYEECIQHVEDSIRAGILTEDEDGNQVREPTAATIWFADWEQKFKRDLRIWNYRATKKNVTEIPKWEKEGMMDFKTDLAMYELGFEFRLDVKAQGEALTARVGDPVVCTFQSGRDLPTFS